MSLDCEIRVDGRETGKAGNGRPESSVVGPVHRFLRDSDFYYRAVFSHLKRCEKCDPKEALDGYLENRVRKHSGETNRTLVEMAEKYRRHFPDRIPEALVREFILRSMGSHWKCFSDRAERLSPSDIERGLKVHLEAWRNSVRAAAPKLAKALSRNLPKDSVSLTVRGWEINLIPCSRLMGWAESAANPGPRIIQLRKLLRGVGTAEQVAAGDEKILSFLRIYEVWDVMTT